VKVGLVDGKRGPSTANKNPVGGAYGVC